MIEITDNVNHDEWDDFLLHHPLGNIFQSNALFNVYLKTKNYVPVILFAYDKENSNIGGILSAVTIREGKGILGDLSGRTIIQGGPLLSEPMRKSIGNNLIKKINEIVGKQCLFTEIRNMHDMSTVLGDIPGYSQKEHLNFIIDLDKTEENLWKQIHKSRRKNINRAERKGVEIEEITKEQRIPLFYSLLQETYSNVGIPLADISLFYAAFNMLVPQNMARFFIARVNDQYIGSRVVLTFKNQIYDWYAGASKNATHYYPNEYLVWHILKWGIENNYSIFDFGGAGSSDKPYGPREFKRRFGGECVNFGRYIHAYSPNKMKMAEFGLKIIQQLRI